MKDDPFHLKFHGITDPAVLKAFQKVRRKDFIDSYLYKLTHVDGPLPIGKGQTISQPSLVAYMTQLLDVHPHHVVLEIGTGSGFQTAILAEIALKVVSVEIIPSLYEKARKRLAGMGYNNIRVVPGDGNKGFSDSAPYDRIMVTAAAERIPDALLHQLIPGGKMVIPVGKQYSAQRLTLVTKSKDGNVKTLSDMGVRFVPFVSESDQASPEEP